MNLCEMAVPINNRKVAGRTGSNFLRERLQQTVTHKKQFIFGAFYKLGQVVFLVA